MLNDSGWFIYVSIMFQCAICIHILYIVYVCVYVSWRVKRKWHQRSPWIADPSTNWRIIIEIQTRDEDDIVGSAELPLVDCTYVVRGHGVRLYTRSQREGMERWKKETGLVNVVVRETGEDGKDMRELPVQLH